MKNLLVLAMTAAMLGSAAAGTASAAVYPADFVGPLQEGDSREAGSAADPAAAIGGGLDQTLGAVGAAYANTDFEPGVTYDCSGGTCWLTKVYPEGSQYISSSWNMNYCEEDPECRDLLNAAKKKQQEREQKAAEEKAKAEEEKRKQAAAKKASDDAAKKALDDANKNMFGANSADASRDIPG
ncbi:MAG: hypothetical protein HY748_08315, partial [Elusimicrobia bacterium]|nr:hypothetical protein [Elusimicrobiota bacterium]